MPGEPDPPGLMMGHLRMIEHAYGITITNKDEICGLVLHATHQPREVLTVALALNNWVAVHHPGRTCAIPEKIVAQIIAGTVGRW